MMNFQWTLLFLALRSWCPVSLLAIQYPINWDVFQILFSRSWWTAASSLPDIDWEHVPNLVQHFLRTTLQSFNSLSSLHLSIVSQNEMKKIQATMAMRCDLSLILVSSKVGGVAPLVMCILLFDGLKDICRHYVRSPISCGLSTAGWLEMLRSLVVGGLGNYCWPGTN